jgi:hypothetical protein
LLLHVILARFRPGSCFLVLSRARSRAGALNRCTSGQAIRDDYVSGLILAMMTVDSGRKFLYVFYKWSKALRAFRANVFQ